jgi:polysaccharide export outer membrane protein
MRPESGYIVGPDDMLSISARDVDEISKSPVRIDLRGDIRLPLIGTVHAAGLTVPALERTLTDRLARYIVRPEVVVSVADFRSQPISIIGAVRNPGVYQVQGRKTLIEVIAQAGGLREDAGHKLIITRPLQSGDLPVPGAKPDDTGRFTVAQLSINSLLTALHPAENIAVLPNDIITVPAADLVYVLGEVHKPGGFPLRKEEQVSALQAISLAEGVLRTASTKHAIIMRRQVDSTRVHIAVDLKRIMAGELRDVPLQPEDILFIPNSIPKNATLRGMETAVQLGTGLIIWRR